MKRLQNLKLDALKRPAVLISVLGVVVLALLWWFFWMTPESNKLSGVHTKINQLQAEVTSDQQTLILVQHESKIVKQNAHLLDSFAKEVPTTPQQQVLTTQIYDLAKSTGVALNSFSDNTLVPATTTGLGEIPVSIAISGNHTQCLNFLDGLFKPGTRLLTVSSFSPAPANSVTAPTNGSVINVLAHDTLQYTFSLVALAYYFPGSTSATTTTSAG